MKRTKKELIDQVNDLAEKLATVDNQHSNCVAEIARLQSTNTKLISENSKLTVANAELEDTIKDKDKKLSLADSTIRSKSDIIKQITDNNSKNVDLLDSKDLTIKELNQTIAANKVLIKDLTNNNERQCILYDNLRNDYNTKHNQCTELDSKLYHTTKQLKNCKTLVAIWFGIALVSVACLIYQMFI